MLDHVGNAADEQVWGKILEQTKGSVIQRALGPEGGPHANIRFLHRLDVRGVGSGEIQKHGGGTVLPGPSHLLVNRGVTGAGFGAVLALGRPEHRRSHVGDGLGAQTQFV
jgi:hypothetical protein